MRPATWPSETAGRSIVDGNGGGSYGYRRASKGVAGNTRPVRSSNSGLGNLISGNFGNGIGIEADQGVAGFRPGYNVASTADVIYGNRIGTTADGEATLGNGWAPDSKGEYGNGISIEDGSNNIQVGGALGTGLGNLISGNGGDGVSIEKNAQGNRVQGNFIGTDAMGAFAIPNGNGNADEPGNGVHMDSANNNLIGGRLGTGLGNVISGNARNGVKIGNGSRANQVQGQLHRHRFRPAGLRSATLAGESARQLRQRHRHRRVLQQHDRRQIPHSGLGNLISGNAGNGVNIEDNSTLNVVQGNYIGTNVAGTAALGNGTNGVDIDDSNNNTIGGDFTQGVGNLISGNTRNGVLIENVVPRNNQVQGQFPSAPPPPAPRRSPTAPTASRTTPRIAIRSAPARSRRVPPTGSCPPRATSSPAMAATASTSPTRPTWTWCRATSSAPTSPDGTPSPTTTGSTATWAPTDNIIGGNLISGNGRGNPRRRRRQRTTGSRQPDRHIHVAAAVVALPNGDWATKVMDVTGLIIGPNFGEMAALDAGNFIGDQHHGAPSGWTRATR